MPQHGKVSAVPLLDCYTDQTLPIHRRNTSVPQHEGQKILRDFQRLCQPSIFSAVSDSKACPAVY